MSQFIRNTSDSCDLVIVGGDFNFRPDQLGYNIIRYNGNLYDSWIERVGGLSHICLINLSKLFDVGA